MKNRKAKVLKLQASKPRNPLVVHAARRKAGTHQKSRKAERRQQQAQLKQALGRREDSGHE
jgi:hypothetical protein